MKEISENDKYRYGICRRKESVTTRFKKQSVFENLEVGNVAQLSKHSSIWKPTKAIQREAQKVGCQNLLVIFIMMFNFHLKALSTNDR